MVLEFRRIEDVEAEYGLRYAAWLIARVRPCVSAAVVILGWIAEVGPILDCGGLEFESMS